MNEIEALEKGLPFFIKVRGERPYVQSFDLFLRNDDGCGVTSYTGQFDFHWSYASWQEAYQAGKRLTK
jgi:hypothetical protein